MAPDVHGRKGQSLDAVWRDGAEAYLGTTVAGFPNLFLLIGPNTGLGHNSMVFMIESQIPYVLDAVKRMRARDLRLVDVRPDVQAAYNVELQRRLEGSVWNTGGCKSWYIDANGRNSTAWPDFTWRFWLRTRRFDPSEYDLHSVALPTMAADSAQKALASA